MFKTTNNLPEKDITIVIYTLVVASIMCVIVAFFGVAAYYDNQDYVYEQSIYCQNVGTWHETGGKFGWPPYKGECN